MLEGGLLSKFEVKSLYELLNLYDEREIDGEIHSIFEGSSFGLPNYWRDEQQFLRSYHAMHRLAIQCELGEFRDIAKSGQIAVESLSQDELDYFTESHVVEDECCYLFDFLTCLHAEKKSEDNLRHIGRG